MKSEKTTVKSLCISGVLIALVCAATMVIQIPIPVTEGYIHPGDSLIFLAAVFFGKKNGLAAGALGSALADILTGYAHWAPFTLIIKGLMGFVVGWMSDYSKKQRLTSFRTALAPVAGALIMVVGYLLAGSVLYGSFTVSLTSVPSNLVQGVGGMAIYWVVAGCLHKAKFYRLVQNA